MLLPWRRISNFTCYRCGLCCFYFRVPLKSYEALKIAEAFGLDKIAIIGGKEYIEKEEGKACPFLVSRNGKLMCSLQDIGLKPVACKLWPFHVYKRPEYGRDEEAYFQHKLGGFYVYVDQRCPGVSLGKPNQKLIRTVEEAIDIWLGIREEQLLTTATIATFSGNQWLLKKNTKGLLAAIY